MLKNVESFATAFRPRLDHDIVPVKPAMNLPASFVLATAPFAD
jgi:hypothetical protein